MAIIQYILAHLFFSFYGSRSSQILHKCISFALSHKYIVTFPVVVLMTKLTFLKAPYFLKCFLKSFSVTSEARFPTYSFFEFANPGKAGAAFSSYYVFSLCSFEELVRSLGFSGGAAPFILLYFFMIVSYSGAPTSRRLIYRFLLFLRLIFY